MTLFSTLLWALSLAGELVMRCFMVRGHCLTTQRDCFGYGKGACPFMAASLVW